MYNFGIYHWRRRAVRLAVGAAVLAVGAVGVRRGGRLRRATGLALLAAGGMTAGRSARKLVTSPPWSVSVEKYHALAEVVPLGAADVVLDVGCGTGRSLVGLAPAIRSDATVLGLDVFDDRVILGNGPALARRNAARAGMTVTPVRGDAARLPFADGTVDAVTLCRVLHDLPKEEARRALVETRRVLGSDGTVGVLELPFPHDDDVEPARYWRELVEDAGFTVTDERTLDGDYFVLAATP